MLGDTQDAEEGDPLGSHRRAWGGGNGKERSRAASDGRGNNGVAVARVGFKPPRKAFSFPCFLLR